VGSILGSEPGSQSSSAHPSEIIERFISNHDLEPPTPDIQLSTKMAGDLDTVLEEQTVAAVGSRDRGPGKRAVKPNSLYAMDKHDWKLKPKPKRK
jgi:hypothetical protein